MTNNQRKEFEELLTNLSERSQSWLVVKNEVKKRGYWKNKPRGVPQINNLNKIKCNLAPASIHPQKTQQVKQKSSLDETSFSDGI